MCTVTFIPLNNENFIFTSNRDEAPERKTTPPQHYQIEGSKLLFPKDEVAGGTWIGLSDKQRLICLLNGGFTAHERKDDYRMSRGIIVKDLLTSSNATDAIQQYDFNGIEPFTIIMVNFEKSTQIFELVWDGDTAHFSEKPLTPQIWSSSLLYSENIKKQREEWFSTFMFDTLRPSAEDILHFHTTAGNGDIENDLIMDRGFVKTKSITQIQKSDNEISMNYQDLQQHLLTETTL